MIRYFLCHRFRNLILSQLYLDTLSLPHFLSLPFWAAADQWQELFAVAFTVQRCCLNKRLIIWILDYSVQFLSLNVQGCKPTHDLIVCLVKQNLQLDCLYIL